MTFLLGQTHSEPLQIGRIGEGKLLVQVLEGDGVWVGDSREGLVRGQQVDSSTVILRDGFFVAAGDGIVEFEWSGPVYLFAPNAATTTTFGNLRLTGCTD